MAKRDNHHPTGALNTLRHTLSEDQWEDALEHAKAKRKPNAVHAEQRDPNQLRHETVKRCLLRVAKDDGPPGIYLVRSVDISSGGIRVIHGGNIPPESICAVIIESVDDRSIAAGGVTAWCNPIKDTDPPAFELGIRFHEPIDISPFTDSTGAEEDAA